MLPGCFQLCTKGRSILFNHFIDMRTTINLSISCRKNVFLLNISCRKDVFFCWKFFQQKHVFSTWNVNKNTSFLHEMDKLTVVLTLKWLSMIAHWDFLPKFLSLHYYTNLEGVLGVQRRGKGQGTIICLLGPLFFSQNGITFKKPTKIITIQWKATVFGDILRVCSILTEKQQPKPIRWT